MYFDVVLAQENYCSKRPEFVSVSFNYAQTSGTAQDKVVEQLTFRVAQLTEEIEGVHAHYQKLIEEIGGPEYTHDMGPLERGNHNLHHCKHTTQEHSTLNRHSISSDSNDKCSAAIILPWVSISIHRCSGGSGSFMSTAGSGGLYEDEGARDQKGVLGSGQGARTDSTSTRRVAKHVPSATISKVGVII